MHTVVIVFPGSNCDRDVAVALKKTGHKRVQMVWHGETTVPPADLIVLPGGFSYGDYLRCGAMAAHSPIMRDVVKKANEGTQILGICNGFQILCETGLLPGALMRNASLNYICRDVRLAVEREDTPFTRGYRKGQLVTVPIAHHDGNYFADSDTLSRIEEERRVVFRYVDKSGHPTPAANPNGSQNNIAGICSPNGRILGMMPHPERLFEQELGGIDGRPLFETIALNSI